jgi:hypothetical protein
VWHHYALSIIGIPIASYINFIHEKVAFLKPTLVFETTALISFGFSWLTKGEFLFKDSKAEKKITAEENRDVVPVITVLNQEQEKQ